MNHRVKCETRSIVLITLAHSRTLCVAAASLPTSTVMTCTNLIRIKTPAHARANSIWVSVWLFFSTPRPAWNFKNKKKITKFRSLKYRPKQLHSENEKRPMSIAKCDFIFVSFDMHAISLEVFLRLVGCLFVCICNTIYLAVCALSLFLFLLLSTKKCV